MSNIKLKYSKVYYMKEIYGNSDQLCEVEVISIDRITENVLISYINDNKSIFVPYNSVLFFENIPPEWIWEFNISSIRNYTEECMETFDIDYVNNKYFNFLDISTKRKYNIKKFV